MAIVHVKLSVQMALKSALNYRRRACPSPQLPDKTIFLRCLKVFEMRVIAENNARESKQFKEMDTTSNAEQINTTPIIIPKGTRYHLSPTPMFMFVHLSYSHTPHLIVWPILAVSATAAGERRASLQGRPFRCRSDSVFIIVLRLSGGQLRGRQH